MSAKAAWCMPGKYLGKLSFSACLAENPGSEDDKSSAVGSDR